MVVVGVSLEGPRRGMMDASECSEGISRMPLGRAMRTAKTKNKREVQIGAVRKTLEKNGRMWRVCCRAKKGNDVDALEKESNWASREGMRKRAAQPLRNALVRIHVRLDMMNHGIFKPFSSI